jgi:hypothetical protein
MLPSQKSNHGHMNTLGIPQQRHMLPALKIFRSEDRERAAAANICRFAPGKVTFPSKSVIEKSSHWTF